jgi:hypothetical protein
MITDPRTNSAHGRRWALWLLMFAGVVLHSSLCPPNVHAGVLGATTRTCVSSAAGTPPSDVRSEAAMPESGRVGDAGRPCAPGPRPHHHAPCGVMTHRGSSQPRSIAPWQDGAVPLFPLPVPSAGTSAGAAGPHPWGRPSRPPVRPSGAGLLIELCSSRT